MYYNVKKLVEETDFVQVLSQLGVPMKQSKDHVLCLCPSHIKNIGKQDTHISNCVIKNNHYTCYACGAYGNIINYVTDYYKYELNKNIKFSDICKIIGDMSGGHELYEGEKNDFVIDLNEKDLEVIGLTLKSSISNIINSDKENHKGFHKYKTEYIKTEPFYYNLLNLYNESPKLYNALIQSKALEAIKKYENICNMMKNRHDEYSVSNYLKYFTLYNNAKKIYENHIN